MGQHHGRWRNHIRLITPLHHFTPSQGKSKQFAKFHPVPSIIFAPNIKVFFSWEEAIQVLAFDDHENCVGTIFHIDDISHSFESIRCMKQADYQAWINIVCVHSSTLLNRSSPCGIHRNRDTKIFMRTELVELSKGKNDEVIGCNRLMKDYIFLAWFMFHVHDPN